MDGVNYISAGKINAVNTPAENNYSFQHVINQFKRIFYKLKITDKDDRSTFSNVVELNKKETAYLKIYPNLVTDNQFSIFSDKPVEQVIIFSAEGKKVFQNRLNNLSGTIPVSLPGLQNGIYIVQLKLESGYVNEKILIARK
jgi:Secretion system C-terminal sorting domain